MTTSTIDSLSDCALLSPCACPDFMCVTAGNALPVLALPVLDALILSAVAVIGLALLMLAVVTASLVVVIASLACCGDCCVDSIDDSAHCISPCALAQCISAS